MTLSDEMTLFDDPTDAGSGTLEAPHDRFVLLARAAFLREVAADVEPLVATSIRRRASELELTAWVLGVRAGA